MKMKLLLSTVAAVALVLPGAVLAQPPADRGQDQAKRDKPGQQRRGDEKGKPADKGAQVILPSELFQGPYFCVAQEERWFAQAHPWRTHPCVSALAPLAAELGVVLPVSIFEKEGPHYFNSLVMIDADGSLMGVYRVDEFFLES